MDNFNNQQQLNVWKTNQEILDIIDQKKSWILLINIRHIQNCSNVLRALRLFYFLSFQVV